MTAILLMLCLAAAPSCMQLNLEVRGLVTAASCEAAASRELARFRRGDPEYVRQLGPAACQFLGWPGVERSA